MIWVVGITAAVLFGSVAVAWWLVQGYLQDQEGGGV